MSLVQSTVLPAIQKRLPKVIGPRTHGVIDYAHAAFFFGLALVCRKSNRPAALAALGTGGFVLVQSLLTDYSLGAVPVIPFATHGAMDASFASASWLIPKVFGFEGTAAAKVFQANSLVEGTVVSLTDFSSERARADRLSELS